MLRYQNTVVTFMEHGLKIPARWEVKFYSFFKNDDAEEVFMYAVDFNGDFVVTYEEVPEELLELTPRLQAEEIVKLTKEQFK